MEVAKHAYAHNNIAPFNQFDVPSTTFALTTKTTTNKLADSNKPKSKFIGTEIIHPIKTVTGMTSKANCVELPIATPMERLILVKVARSMIVMPMASSMFAPSTKIPAWTVT